MRATAGEASAQATLQARRQREGNQHVWHLAGDGELNQFDPLPWWPGAAGTVWANGPHRVNGRWRLDLQLPETLAEQLRRQRDSTLAALRGQLQLDFADSVLAGLPMTARVDVRGDGQALGVRASWAAVGNQVSLEGRLAVAAPRTIGSSMPRCPRWPRCSRYRGWCPPARRVLAARRLGELAGPTRWSVATAARWQRHVADQRPARRRARTHRGPRALAVRWQRRRAHRAHAQRERAPARRATPRPIAGAGRWHAARAPHHGTSRDPGAASGVEREPGRQHQHRHPRHARSAGGWNAAAAGGGRWQATDTSLRVIAREGNGEPWLDIKGLQGEAGVRRPRRAHAGAALTGPCTVCRRRRAALERGFLARRRAAAGSARRTRAAGRGPAAGAAAARHRMGRRPHAGRAHRRARRRTLRSRDRAGALRGDLHIADESGIAQALGIDELQLAFTARDGIWQFAQGLAGRQIGEMAGAQVVRTAPSRAGRPQTRGSKACCRCTSPTSAPGACGCRRAGGWAATCT